MMSRTFADIRQRHPDASEQTFWRMLADVDRYGRCSVPVVYYDKGQETTTG